MARGLKFFIQEGEGLYYPCSENKGADQLSGHREADLRHCFRICKSPVFSRTWFKLYQLIYSILNGIESIYLVLFSYVYPNMTFSGTYFAIFLQIDYLDFAV